MGRPRKYQDGPGRFTLVLSPADKEVVEDFSRWYQFTTRRTMGVAEILLEILRKSREFETFQKAGRADGPLFAQLAQEPAAVTPQAAPVEKPVPPASPAPVAQPVATEPPAPVPSAPEPVEAPEVQAAPLQEPALGVAEIREAAKAAGLSGRELARRAGLDPGAVSVILAGKRIPKPETLLKLKAALEG